MTYIPQEITDAILEQVAGCHESSDVWRTCALVSTSFRPYSQKLLFRTIKIDTAHPSLSRLHAVLEDAPHLATHVQELTLSITPRGLTEVLETLLDTLTRFTRVTNCTWTEYGVSGPSWEWSTENFRMKLYQFLRLPSLARVVIHGAGPVLVDFLASCEQLKSLTVNVPSDYVEGSHISISPAAASVSTTRSTPGSGLLEELIIHQSRNLELIHSLTSQSSRLHLSRLRKFTLIRPYGNSNLEEAEIGACQQVLDLCADSLEELAFGKDLLIVTLPLSVAAPASHTTSADISLRQRANGKK